MQTAALPEMASRAITTEAPAQNPAFAEVYRDYFDFVWRSVRALGTRHGAVEDVVQEIFVVVHRRLPEFEGRSTMRTWLSKIVLNVVRHHRRSVVRKSPHELSNEEPQDPDALPTKGHDPYESAALSERTRLVQRLPTPSGTRSARCWCWRTSRSSRSPRSPRRSV